MENIRRLPLGWQGALDQGWIKGSEPLKRTPLKINHLGFQGL